MRLACALTTALLLAACGSTPNSRFYLLTPLDAEASESPGGAPSTVRLASVEMPRYLAGPEIVVRDGNHVKYGQYDRWGEPLRDNFSRVLAQNLATLLPGTDVSRFLWEWPGPVDVQVSIAIQRFDVEGGEAILEARWALYGTESAVVTRGSGRSRFVHALGGSGYGAMAAALSACLSGLSREIADDLRAAAATP
jgi:uncharacterized lipoprotein YmbA